VKDILWSERQLLVRAAKAARTAGCPSAACLGPLKFSSQSAHGLGARPRRCPDVGVTLRFSCEEVPKSAFDWPWFWVFPPGTATTRSRGARPLPLLYDSLQRPSRGVAQAAWIARSHPYPQHAYATHSREAIEACAS